MRTEDRLSETPTLPPGRLEAAASSVKDRPCLTVMTGMGAGRIVSIGSDEIVVGRDFDEGVHASDVSLSRRHARFFRVDDDIYVQDLGSMNGTFVQGRRILTPVRLRDGDRVQLGPNRVVRFNLHDQLEVEAALLLHETSVRDSTTGAFNRAHFERRLQAESAFAHRHEKPLTLLLLDIDEFKKVNDALGHLFGDVVLRVFGATVQRFLRPTDLVARYGGDEFTVLCRDTTLRNGLILADRIRVGVERMPLMLGGNEVRITASIGVATALHPQINHDSLIAAADRAMYDAKSRGRNAVRSAIVGAG